MRWTDGSPLIYTNWSRPGYITIPDDKRDCYTIDYNMFISVCRTIKKDDMVYDALVRFQPYSANRTRLCTGLIYHGMQSAWALVPCSQRIESVLQICEVSQDISKSLRKYQHYYRDDTYTLPHDYWFTSGVQQAIHGLNGEIRQQYESNYDHMYVFSGIKISPEYSNQRGKTMHIGELSIIDEFIAEANLFRCNDGTYIGVSQKCDQYANCRYGEDENNCEIYSKSVTALDKITSFPGTFVCRDYTFINVIFKCDTFQDCSQGEDEEECPIMCDAENGTLCAERCSLPDCSCGALFFQCESGGCQPASLVSFIKELLVGNLINMFKLNECAFYNCSVLWFYLSK